ncbi:MAG: hypothetical protein KDD34_04180 [Bdellovibrionales bacterium]|nr:hypothetical protein [Bdellovibrionales bacterium]
MKHARNKDELSVELIGYIGEGSPLFDLPLQGVKKLIIDLEKVNYINSVGIKNWITWTRKIPEDCDVLLRNVLPSVVNQINVVVGFLPPRSTLESIQVPYYCDTCNKEESLLYQLGQHYFMATETEEGRVVHPEDVACGKPDCTFTTDVLESKYFAFLKKKDS